MKEFYHLTLLSMVLGEATIDIKEFRFIPPVIDEENGWGKYRGKR